MHPFIISFVCVFLALSLLERIRFHKYVGENVHGPKFWTPILGGLLPMVYDPESFWKKQQEYSNGISWNSIFGRLMIFSVDVDTSKKIFINKEGNLRLALHPNAEWILGKDNIAFMHGEDHKQLRTTLLKIFHKSAMYRYLDLQRKTIIKHISEWVGNPVIVADVARDLNVETSLLVFIGSYFDDDERRIAHGLYANITKGFLALPLYFPGTTLWKAMTCRKNIVDMFTVASSKSRRKISTGGEPDCLLDYWMEHVLKMDKPYTDEEVAKVLLDFLFASQDASTASLTWIPFLMSRHPNVLRKVRQELEDISFDPNQSISLDTLSKLKYSEAVVKETLRYRPPATMVPHVAVEKYKVTENYIAPKGCLVIPDIVSACKQGISYSNLFIPERWYNPEPKLNENFLVFGFGPHKCLGYEYAKNHLLLFLIIISTLLEWKVYESDQSNHITYKPTIYPACGCVTRFQLRGKVST